MDEQQRERAEEDRLFYHHLGVLLFIGWWLEAAAFFAVGFLNAHPCLTR